MSKLTTGNRIDELFAKCRTEKRAALIPYLTAGFPNAEITARVLPVLENAGCDLIELGIPFSDPIADGPIIQRSSTLALRAGMTFSGALSLLQDFRAQSNLPVILFGALNPYYAKGLANTASLAAEAGADGILAADLPYEEAEEFRDVLTAQGLHLITLVAPTTPDARLVEITSKSSGFVYCIAMKGTTGQLSGVAENAQKYLDRLRKATELPLALGFGISKPEHVRSAVDAGADAVVVGSSLITVIEEAYSSGGDIEKVVDTYIRSLAAELVRR